MKFDTRIGAIERVQTRDADGPLIKAIRAAQNERHALATPNRLYGAALNAEGDAI